MVEPASTPYSVLKDLNVKKGSTVLIAGGGIIGSLTAQWAKYFGAKYVAMTEINQFRADKNRKDGYADEVFDGKDPEIVKKLLGATGGVGFDYFIECTGNGIALKVGMAVCKMRGKVGVVGVSPVDIQFSIILIITKRLTVKGYLGYSVAEFDEVLSLIANKEFEVMSQYSRDVTLEEAEDTFRKLQDPAGTDVKVMIKFK
jgi:threonine dehydrogenase-like Zn-dependent dehydrogenase